MKNLFIAFIILISSSCNKDDSSNDSIAQFAGNWSGTYHALINNTDSGTFNIIVKKDGSITGTVNSLVYKYSYPLLGAVNSSGKGTFSFSGSKTSGLFTAKFLENDVSGDWTTHDDVSGVPGGRSDEGSFVGNRE